MGRISGQISVSVPVNNAFLAEVNSISWMLNHIIAWGYEYQQETWADPGLVAGGGANSLRGPTQYIYTFSEQPHEIKELLVRRGGLPGAPPP